MLEALLKPLGLLVDAFWILAMPAAVSGCATMGIVPGDPAWGWEFDGG